MCKSQSQTNMATQFKNTPTTSQHEHYNIAKSTKQDKFCKNKVCELQTNIDDMFYLNTDSFLKWKVIINNLEVNTTVIPSALTYTLMHEFHYCRVHQGCTRMLNLLKRKFWWKGMRRDVKCHINSCITCSKNLLILHITLSYIWKFPKSPLPA